MKVLSSLPELQQYKSRLIICDIPIQLNYKVAARFDLNSQGDWKSKFAAVDKLEYQDPCVYILHTENEYSVILYVPDGFNREPSPFKLELLPENDSSLILWYGINRLTSYSISLPKILLTEIFDIYLSSVQCACFMLSKETPDIPLIKNQLLSNQGNFHADFPAIRIGQNFGCQFNTQGKDFECQVERITKETECMVDILNDTIMEQKVSNYTKQLQAAQYSEAKHQVMKCKARMDLIEQRVFMKDIMGTAMNFIKDLINHREERVNALEELLNLRNAEISDLNERNKMLTKISSTTNLVSKQIVKLTHNMEDDREEQRMDDHKNWNDVKKLMINQGNQLKSILDSSLDGIMDVANGKDELSGLGQKVEEQNIYLRKVLTEMDKNITALKSSQRQNVIGETQEISNKIDQLVRLTRSYEIEKVKYAEALKDMNEVQNDRNRLIKDNEELLEKLEQIMGDLDTEKHTTQTISNSMRIYETEISKLKKQKKNLELEIENVRNELRLEKEDRDTIEDSNSTQVKRNRQLVEKYRNELENIKKVKNELEEEKYESGKKIEELQHKLKMTVKKFEKQNQGQETGFDVLQDQVDYLTVKLQDAESQKQILKRHNDDLSDRLMLLEKKSSISAAGPKIHKPVSRVSDENDQDSAVSIKKPLKNNKRRVIATKTSPKKRLDDSAARPKRERKKPKFQEYNEMISSEMIDVKSISTKSNKSNRINLNQKTDDNFLNVN
eukprot:NODE_419_length_7785_cov_0.861158.p1 type:complete len:729 gc:universal NODE_419_length_7785_cov_0.861158:6480-4294(-)